MRFLPMTLTLIAIGLPLLGSATLAQKTVSKQVTHTAKKVVRQTKKAAVNVARVAKNVAETPLWPKLQETYQYDNSAPPEVKEETIDKGTYTLIKLSFTGSNGKPVEGVLLRPKEGDVFPCALALHGLTQNKETAIADFGNRLVAHGIMVLALDAPQHGKQRVAGKNLWQEEVIRTALHDGVLNYRRILDYLETRQDVDKERIGLIGVSLGGLTGPILGGVDERIKAFALCAGGDPILPVARVMPASPRRDATFAVSPSLFIGHITPRPILMINGRTDPLIVPPSAQMLYQNAQSPKQSVWYNGTHEVPVSMRQKAADWLVEKLKKESH